MPCRPVVKTPHFKRSLCSRSWRARRVQSCGMWSSNVLTSSAVESSYFLPYIHLANNTVFDELFWTLVLWLASVFILVVFSMASMRFFLRASIIRPGLFRLKTGQMAYLQKRVWNDPCGIHERWNKMLVEDTDIEFAVEEHVANMWGELWCRKSCYLTLTEAR